MSDLSGVQTTSFYTRLTFLDEESDDSLFDDVDDEDNKEYRAEYNTPDCKLTTVCFHPHGLICVNIYIAFFLQTVGSKDTFDQYLTQLLHSTTTKSYLPPIQRGQHHVFSPEHTTRDILSFMAQVQGLKMPSQYSKCNIYHDY